MSGLPSPTGFTQTTGLSTGLGFSLGYGLAFQGFATWTPILLFANGEQGAWYDPSDFSTMFQDAVGTTPVTAVEQPVGLVLDKSKGVALGAELLTNGDFSNSTTGWTASGSIISTDAGRLKITALATYGFAYQAITTVIGQTYKLTYSLTNGDATGCYMYVDPAAGLNAANFDSGAKADGSYFAVFVATATTTYVKPFIAGSGKFAFYDNISVKELAGNHASQSTPGSRPVLSARVNLLTYSEQFDNAAWPKSAGVSVPVTNNLAPDGTLTADTVTSTTGYQIAQAGIVTTIGITYTTSAWIKKTVGATVFPMLDFYSAPTEGQVILNTNTGVANVRSGTSGATNVVVTDAANYWRLSFATVTASASSSVLFYPAASTDGTSYLGGLSASHIIWGADLRVTNVGSNMPAYQRVGAATYGTSTVAGNPDYDTSGFPFFLGFNGTTGSRSMVSSTITPGTDKAQVFAGARKLSDAGLGVFAELSTSVTNAGTFSIYAPNTSGTYASLLNGSALGANNYATFTAPITNVLTNLYDIAQPTIATEISFRANGVVVSGSSFGAADAGTGNFGNYPLYIGARGGSNLYYNGNLYSLIVRFGTDLPESTIDQTEVWVGNKTGLDLTYAVQQTIFDRFNATILDRLSAIILQRY